MSALEWEARAGKWNATVPVPRLAVWSLGEIFFLFDEPRWTACACICTFFKKTLKTYSFQSASRRTSRLDSSSPQASHCPRFCRRVEPLPPPQSTSTRYPPPLPRGLASIRGHREPTITAIGRSTPLARRQLVKVRALPLPPASPQVPHNPKIVQSSGSLPIQYTSSSHLPAPANATASQFLLGSMPLVTTSPP